MMKKSSVLFAVVLAGMMTAAHAADTCRVTNPTGTPLNVRDAPNGNRIGTLQNGTTVRATDVAEDNQGRNWVYVYWQGQPLSKSKQWGAAHEGWVIREYVSCVGGSLGSKN